MSSNIGDANIKVHLHQMRAIAFMEDSSEDENDEKEEEKKQKERKKATEKTLCVLCGKSSRPDLLLLCDSCDDAWHTHCLRPKLWFVPDGDWFCPICEHNSLLKKLTFALLSLREDLKKREVEEKKKIVAADRLKREMDFIGISLHNVIPSGSARKNQQQLDSSSVSDVESDIDDGQRRSKKKAMKRVMKKTRELHKLEIQRSIPVLTVTEGRSRRGIAKVDYNFMAYDEQLQEAIKQIDPSQSMEAPSKHDNMRPHMSASGLGRGKDMKNIIEAEKKRKRSEEESNDNNPQIYSRNPQGQSSRPAARKTYQGKKHKRLTDLDIDNATESETDEYEASSFGEEDPEPSEDEYLPSERTTRLRIHGRHKSDDDFIDDNDGSESEYEPSGKKKMEKRKKVRERRRKGYFNQI